MYLYDVTDDQFANLNLLCSSAADDIEGLFAFDAILQAAKLLLLRPIIEGSDDDNNDDCNENGSAFDPSVFIFFFFNKAY